MKEGAENSREHYLVIRVGVDDLFNVIFNLPYMLRHTEALLPELSSLSTFAEKSGEHGAAHKASRGRFAIFNVIFPGSSVRVVNKTTSHVPFDPGSRLRTTVL